MKLIFLLNNFHTLSYTMKQTIFILEKEQSEESVSSPFVATLFGLPVSLKVVGIGKKIKILIQC